MIYTYIKFTWVLFFTGNFREPHQWRRQASLRSHPIHEYLLKLTAKKKKYWTSRLLRDSLIQVGMTLPVCFNHPFIWRRGRIVSETLRCLFYFTQCLMDKIQTVNYSKRDEPSSEAHTFVAHRSHRPENPKSRIISWTHNAEDGLLIWWDTVPVLWSTLCWHGEPLSPCYGPHFADTMSHCHRAMVYTLLTRWATVTVLCSTLCWHGGQLSPCYGLQFADTVSHCHRAMFYTLLTRWVTVPVLWSTVCWHGGPLSPCYGLCFRAVIDLPEAGQNAPVREGELKRV